jgi:hypothetical protein
MVRTRSQTGGVVDDSNASAHDGKTKSKAQTSTDIRNILMLTFIPLALIGLSSSMLLRLDQDRLSVRPQKFLTKKNPQSRDQFRGRE